MKAKAVGFLVLLSIVCIGAEPQCGDPVSTSGVRKATVTVETDPETGLTLEQQNIAGRLHFESRPGVVRHLYVISPFDGKVILYSSVRGKETSSGKRLSPHTIRGESSSPSGFKLVFGSDTMYTEEVLQDDGTYGSSEGYIFWWDTNGKFHKHLTQGGQIVHVSEEPLPVEFAAICVTPLPALEGSR